MASSTPQLPLPGYKIQLYLKLLSHYKDKSDQIENFLRILYYLDSASLDVWKILGPESSSILDFDFNTYIENYIAETKHEENDAAFRQTLNLVYDQVIGVNDNNGGQSVEDEDGFECCGGAEDFDLSKITCFKPLADCWPFIPESRQSEILVEILNLISNRELQERRSSELGPSASASKALNEVKTHVKNIATSIAEIPLHYDNFRRWKDGEITGKRCALNIVNDTVPVTARVAGCVGGAVLGAIAGGGGTRGMGTSLIGSAIGSRMAGKLADMLNEKMAEFLNIPQEEALENAYKFFGVPMTASNEEVKLAFRKLCLKHHPDKGGKAEDFILVQAHMAVIERARGNLG